MPLCPICQDVEWVCENHPDRPWSKDKPNGCVCGAGDPCPNCNSFSELERRKRRRPQWASGAP